MSNLGPVGVWVKAAGGGHVGGCGWGWGLGLDTV